MATPARPANFAFLAAHHGEASGHFRCVEPAMRRPTAQVTCLPRNPPEAADQIDPWTAPQLVTGRVSFDAPPIRRRNPGV